MPVLIWVSSFLLGFLRELILMTLIKKLQIENQTMPQQLQQFHKLV